MALSSFLMVALAVISEHMFNAQPCYSCVVERAGFLLVTLFSIFMLSRNKVFLAFGFIGNLTAMCFLSYTFYQHVGTDQGWWFSTCGQKDSFWLSEYIPYIFEVKGVCGMNTFEIIGLDMLYWAVGGLVLLILLFLSALPSVYKRLFWNEQG